MGEEFNNGSLPLSSTWFGIHRTRPAYQPLDTTENCDNKYPEDTLGLELDENSRVWHVYHDEATVYDQHLVARWKDTIDVLLVFAGLFSAVVTTFVVQTFQSLQPDYTQISAALLAELINTRRVDVGLTALQYDNVPLAISFNPTLADLWTNSLWFVSLALSLATALLCVLIREWLQRYTNNLLVRPRMRARVRHFRFIGLQKWRVPLIIAMLPQFLGAALFFFFAGLSVFLFQINYVIASVVTTIGFALLLFYIISSIIPVVSNPQCPFRTPLTGVWYAITREAQLFHQAVTDNVYRSPPPAKSFDASELEAIRQQRPVLEAEALVWLYKSVSNNNNPSVSGIVLQSLSGLYPNRPLDWVDDVKLKEILVRHDLHKQVAKQYCMRAGTAQSMAITTDPTIDRLERGCRSFATDLAAVTKDDEYFTICQTVTRLLKDIDIIREARREQPTNNNRERHIKPGAVSQAEILKVRARFLDSLAKSRSLPKGPTLPSLDIAVVGQEENKSDDSKVPECKRAKSCTYPEN